jgi:hypothetical protein
MRKIHILSLCAILSICVSVSQAAFLVEAHSSGLANKNFTGPGTPSGTPYPSKAPGVTATNAVYGGSHDYTYTYTPALDMDNYFPVAGTDLKNGHQASGLLGGPSGKYNVYITWPASTNVNTSGCSITVTNDGDNVVLNPINMNTGGTGNPGGNNGWFRIAENVHLTAGVKYTIRQKANSTSAVSQRSHGVLWELVEADPFPVTLTETDGKTAVAEGGATDEYVVTMTQQPPVAVEVLARSTDPNQLVLNGSLNETILTFTPANWATPQTVKVAAYDDLVVEYDHVAWISHRTRFADPNTDDPNSIFSNGFAGYIRASITDNEVPDVRIAESGGSTSVAEEGPTSDTYTLRLLFPPTAPVVVTITADAETVVSAGGPAGSTAQATFTTANWITPQTVIVTAVDDSDLEFNHTSVLKHTVTSTDAGYNGLAVRDVTVAIADNDCGVWGYSPMDFNKDCVVDLEDFAVFAAEWLRCSQPFDTGCVNRLAP